MSLSEKELKKLYSKTGYDVSWDDYLQECKALLSLNRKKAKADIESDKLFFDSFIFRKIQENKDKKQMQILCPPKIKEGIYTCRKCGSKRVSVIMAQLRSADEGMSAICQCTACGAKWK